MGGAGRIKRLALARKSLEQTKRAIRREAENRAYRKAARLALDCWAVGTAHREQAEETAKAILKLVKPKIENPGFSIVER